MKKKFLLMLIALALALIVKQPTTSAEQAAAEQYRQMFKSGNFYVEYQSFDMYLPVKLPSLGLFSGLNPAWNARYKQQMTIYKQQNKSSNSLLPFGKFGLFGGKNNFNFIAGQNGKRIKSNLKSKIPDVMYQDGKYYRYWTDLSRKNKTFQKMIVLQENMLNSPFLDPDQEWQNIKSDLALPEELAVFYWDEPYRKDSIKSLAPQYNGSSTRTINKQDYECDQYVSYISSLANTNIAMEAYNMLYQNGKLVKIQKYFIRNGKETLVSEMDIKTITSQVPESAFTIKKKVKVYAANIGDMNDLLEKEEVVETIGGSK